MSRCFVRRVLSSALFIVFLAGCGTSPVVEPPKTIAPKATDVEGREYKDAEATYRAHKPALALKKFSSFIQRHPKNDLTDDAYYFLGQIYFEQADYIRASKAWRMIVDSQTASQYYQWALVGAAQAESQLGHYDDALSFVRRLRINETTDRALATQAFDLSAKLKLQKGDPLGAVADLLGATDYSPVAGQRQALLNRAGDIVTGNMNQKDLETLLSDARFARLELPARFRLGQFLYDEKSWSSAKGEFNTVIAKFPATEQSKRAQIYISSLDSQERTDSTVIGAILPLTGKYAQQGYKTLRGIQLGLGLFNKSNPSPIKLAIIDSEGNPDVARRGVERLVSEDHVIAVIGDIMSKTAQAVATKAQEMGVPCLSLAQKQGLTDIGDFVFRNTLTADMQMRNLVDVAMNDRGLKRFAILYPNDSYGTEYASLFWDYVLLKGGQITAAQSYLPEETDFRDVVQRLVGTYYAEEDRGKELQLRLVDWQKDQAKNAATNPKAARASKDNAAPKDILPPIVDFDAVFIPDRPYAVGQIAPMFAYNNVDSMTLLGTNIWDSPQLITRAGKYVENSLFVDNYFGDDQSAAMKHFTADFKSEFNYVPDVFEAQGYDSAILISNILKSYNFSISRAALKERLASGAAAQGSTGAIHVDSQREVEKSLVPLTVINGKIVKLETKAGAPQ